MAEKPKATHALKVGAPPRILPTAERAEVDKFVLGVIEHEFDELSRLVGRVCAADRMDPQDGLLVVADVRGPVGAWLLEVLSQGKISAEQYSIQASREHRFAPVVAQFWSEDLAAVHLPKMAPGVLELMGPRLDDKVRAVVINKANQAARVFIELDEESGHA